MLAVSEGAIFITIMCAMFPAVFIVAMVVKYREIQKAKSWEATKGKVLISDVDPRKLKPGDAGYNFHDTDIVNEPLIEYEYTVGGKKFSGRRITIGDKTSTYELEGILSRYPVGAEVTVYYDPQNPQMAVLERDFPGWVWGVGIGCVVAMIVFPIVSALLYLYGVDWLKPHLNHPDRAPFVTAAAGFGLVVLLFALAFTAYVLKACRWPTTHGRILMSDSEWFLNQDSDGGRLTYRTHYKPVVVYGYEVNGRRYMGDRVTIGVVTSSTSPGLAKRLAARYPVGTEVKVRYDPNKPSESVLMPYSLLHLLPWIVAGLMGYLAWWAGMG